MILEKEFLGVRKLTECVKIWKKIRLVRPDRQLSTHVIAEELNLNMETVRNILMKHFYEGGFKNFDSWAKQQRLDIYLIFHPIWIFLTE